MRDYFVYIMASKKNWTLYIWVTNNLIRRVQEHRQSKIKGFTEKYNVKTLVHYEHTDNIEWAIFREKQLKKWKRQWKINLIEENNPKWEDLYDDILWG